MTVNINIPTVLDEDQTAVDLRVFGNASLTILEGVEITDSQGRVFGSFGGPIVNFGTLNFSRFGSARIEFFRNNSVFENHGEASITSSAPGIGFIGINRTDQNPNNQTFINTGTFTVEGTVFKDRSAGDGLYNANIINSGTVSGGRDVAFMTQEFLNNADVDNTGTLSGGTFDLGGAGTTDVSNSGLIDVTELRIDAAQGAVIDNDGTITISQNGVRGEIIGGDAADEIDNDGTITADVFLFGGDDVFENDGRVEGVVDLGAGDDTFIGRDGAIVTARINGGIGDDTITTGDGNDDVRGGEDADSISTGDGDDLITGGSGTDTLSGQSGNDTVRGGSENDTVFGGGGSDVLEGQDGDDSVNGGKGRDTITGEDGNDTLNGQNGADDVDGGDGNDDIDGGNANDTVQGGRGDDAVAGGAGDDSVDGGSGADDVSGGRGNDTVLGGTGDDTLTGGTGDDTLTGGNGADDFVISRTNNGNDVITDFGAGADQIDLGALGVADFAALETANAFAEDEGGVTIDLDVIGGSGSVLLEGVTLAQLNENDFLF